MDEVFLKFAGKYILQYEMNLCVSKVCILQEFNAKIQCAHGNKHTKSLPAW